MEPDFERFLETVLDDPPLQSKVGQPGAVCGLVEVPLGLVEKRIERRHVADQQRGVGGVEL